MKSIPLVLLEEHHDAFFLWHSAIHRGWLAKRGNTLLHVDSHSDMVLPVLHDPLPEGNDLLAVQRFTYTNLDIATFILPAVHQRIFNRVVYMRSQHPVSALGWRRLALALEPDGRMTLRTRTGSVFQEEESVRRLDYARITSRSPIDKDQPIVLDVDLDFFCTNENPHPAINQIETTRAVYEDAQSNPYNLLHLIPRLNVSVVERDKRYFLVFYDVPATSESPEEQKMGIHHRMDDFIESLRSSAIQPVLISLCRSFYSGYTPAKWADYIQSLLLARLEELYTFETTKLKDLFATNCWHGILNPRGEERLEAAVPTYAMSGSWSEPA